jgi:hypothetical protein
MQMKTITKLTPVQEGRLVEFREEWRKVGLCCDPADFETGDDVIRGFYRRLNKPDPIILHFSSPAMCELAVNFVFHVLKDSQLDSQLHSKLDSQLYSQLGSQLYSQLGSQLHSQLYSQLGSQLYSQLDSQLGSQLHSELYSQLDSQLYSQLGSQLYSQLGSQLYSQLDSQLYSQLDSQLDSQLGSQLHSQLYSQLGSQLYSQLDSQLRSQLDSQLHSQLYSQLGSQLYSQLDKLRPYFLNNRWGSQHWCAWEAFYLFGHEIGVEYSAEDIALLREWARLSKSIGWWAPWDGICFVSDRPRHVSFDAARRLHSETGMAVEYSDGWGVHAWHGLRVPAEFINDRDKITFKQIQEEGNLELRRVLRDLYGRDRYLADIGAVEVNRSAANSIYESRRRC